MLDQIHTYLKQKKFDGYDAFALVLAGIAIGANSLSLAIVAATISLVNTFYESK